MTLAIVSHSSDLTKQLDGWIEAQDRKLQFPVPFDGDPMDNFTIALMALAKLKENRDYFNIDHKAAQIGKWRRDVAMPSEDRHSIVIEMIDAVQVWGYHWWGIACKAEEKQAKSKGGFVYAIALQLFSKIALLRFEFSVSLQHLVPRNI